MRGKWALGAATAVLATFGGVAFAQTESATSDAPAAASTRARLDVGGDAAGNLSPAGDADWFRVTVRAGQLYHFRLVGDGDGALDDPMLVLYDSEGVEVARNDDFGGELNSQIDYVSSGRGNMFLEARGFSDEATGGYRLSASAEAAPADDAGNGTSTRARANVGATVSGVLEYPADRDWFRVRLEAGQSYRFALASDDESDATLGDPMLRLIGPNGEELAVDDDGGGGLNSYIEFTAATAGDYFLEARGFGEDATGAYRLTVGEGDIPSDASTDATLSADGDYRGGALAPAGDRDWYRIELQEGQAIRVALDGAEGGLGDPMLVIYGPEGEELARNDDSRGSLNSRLEFTAPAAGAYFAEARGFLDDADGEYEISIVAGEVGDTVATADSLSVEAGRVSSVIGADGDVDWYGVEMVEGRPYRFNLVTDDESSSFDPFLTLYDSEGAELASDDDGGAGLNSYLTYTSVTGGSYYVGVSSFENSGSGAYTLMVADTEVPGNVNTDEALSEEDGERASAIEFAGDRDFYRADLAAGVRYTITLNGTGDGPLANPLLTVISADDAEVARDDDSGPGLNSRLAFTPTASGAYYIVAAGARGSTGKYVVSLTRDQR